MSEWIDGDDAMVGSQYPFSAAATVDLIAGNIERCYDQSAWQIQVGSHQEDDAAQSITPADEWVVFTPVVDIPVPIRRDRDGWRALKITALVKSSSGAELDIRIYAVPGGYAGTHPPPDTDDGYIYGYAELSTTSTSFETQTGTLSAADVGIAARMKPAPALSASAPTTETPRIYLIALAKSKTSTTTAGIMGLHLEEVIA